MKWRNTYKPYTLENALAQIAIGAVLMIGYTIVEEIRWKRMRGLYY
jgi:hypothetical protein